jgi:hypothetical protein
MAATRRRNLLQGITCAYGYEPVASIGDVCVFNLGGLFYVVEVGEYQVKSVGADNPRDGRWFANGVNDSSIRYVANGRSRRAAIAMMRRECAEA